MKYHFLFESNDNVELADVDLIDGFLTSDICELFVDLKRDEDIL